MDETNTFICSSTNDIGISLYEESLDELLTGLNGQIAMLWQEYALAPDESLRACS